MKKRNVSASASIIWYICLKLESCANGVYYPSYTGWIQEVFFIIFCFYSFLAHATLTFSYVRYFIDAVMCFKRFLSNTYYRWSFYRCREINLMNVENQFRFLETMFGILCTFLHASNHDVYILSFPIFIIYLFYNIVCLLLYLSCDGWG